MTDSTRLVQALKRIRHRLERVTPPGTLHIYATDICELLDALQSSQQDTKRLDELFRRGLIPHGHPAMHPVYDREDLDRFLASPPIPPKEPV